MKIRHNKDGFTTYTEFTAFRYVIPAKTKKEFARIKREVLALVKEAEMQTCYNPNTKKKIPLQVSVVRERY